jgi:phosphoglucosamine mutase
LQVLAVVKRQQKPVSEICHRFEPLPQILKNVRYQGGRPLDTEAVIAAIANARSRLGATGRLVIRPSGTEPVIRVMAEADDEAMVSEIVAEVSAALERAAAS